MLRTARYILIAAGVAVAIGCSSTPPASTPAADTPAASDAVTLPEGMTSTRINSELPAAGHRDYAVTVAQGELFMVTVSAGETEIGLDVLKDGKPVTGISSGPMFWGGYAPTVGPFTLSVKGPAKTKYVIEVRRPRRVLFDKGADLATLKGTALAQAELDYVVHAHPGQRLVFELQSASAAPYISVVRASDGKVLLDHASQADIFETLADADAEYIVTVVAGSVDAEFTLLVRLGK
ncbi:MAG: hypothetical protein WCQ64_11795 [Acidobacteriota bacterium]